VKLEKYEDIEAELVIHFSGLLKEPEEDLEAATQAIIKSISSLVSLERNLSLMRPTTLGEVEQTIREMATRKSPV